MKPTVWASVLHQTSGYWTFLWLSWLMSTCLILNFSIILLLKEGKCGECCYWFCILWCLISCHRFSTQIIIKTSTKGRLSPHSMKADLWKIDYSFGRSTSCCHWSGGLAPILVPSLFFVTLPLRVKEREAWLWFDENRTFLPIKKTV